MSQQAVACDDVLGLAAESLNEMAIPGGPSAKAVKNAARLPWAERDRGIERFLISMGVAGTLFIFFGVGLYAAVQYSAEIPFADVVRATGATHSYTANIYIAGLPEIHVAATRQATATQMNFGELSQAKKFDLYALFHDFVPGSAMAVGGKMINGRNAQGFRLPRFNGDEATCIVWVDPSDKLPVQIESGAMFISDLRFDLPSR